jgi:hypothetical protein
MKQEIQIAFDANARLLYITFRRPMDVQPTTLAVPVAMLKSAIGQIIVAEAQAEAQEQAARRIVVHDSNGIRAQG